MKVRYDDIRVDRVLLKDYITEIYKLAKTSRGLEDLAFYRKILEDKIREFSGARYVFLLDSGTSALQVALLASGLKKGDSVIVPAISNPATYAALASLELRPIYLDIKKGGFSLDSKKISSLVRKDTKAILVVHLYGLVADMPSILKVAEKYDLKVIEDSCQAFGSEIKRKKSGLWGDFGVFSFRYYKTLSSIDGQGGAVVCQNPEYGKKIKSIILDDKQRRLLKIMRIPALDAVVLKVKMDHIREIIQSKIEGGKIYEKLLAGQKGLEIPEVPPNSSVVWQFYPIFASNRDKLVDFLRKNGIHLEEAYKIFGGIEEKNISEKALEENYPNSLIYEKQALPLPLFPFIKKEEIIFIANLIKEFYRKNGE